ncbi:MAG TPA: VOC family protein, partial [Solirubrobacteraceae bacterium]
TPIDPDLRIGAVQLAVSDLPRSVDFYERVLGLALHSADEDVALLGGDEPEHAALELLRLADPRQTPPHSTGLFHVAWLHPTRATLASTVRRIAGAGWPIEGAADHGISEALYLSDPDGLGIEIYADRPRSQWQRPPDGRGVRMVTLALDIEDLLAQWQDQPTMSVARGTAIGHVHMKVSDVARAERFYRDVLGFEEQAQIPSAAFLSAGGYHHHIGLNSWQSRGGSPAPAGAPGLQRIDLELGSGDALQELERRLSATAPAAVREQDRGVLLVGDSDEQLLRFTHS